MASWVLVADLTSLRNEFNALAPNRDKASDGSIGDAAHQKESSDHNPDETGATPYEDADNINEVHAIDVDNNLNKPGWDMQRAVDIIVGRHKNGTDNRLQNVIYNRKIWSRSWGWTEHPYTGLSAHTEHAHFSSRYGSGTTGNPEADTRPWGLLAALEGNDDMTIEELTAELKKGPDKSELAFQFRKLLMTYPTGQSGPDSSYLADFSHLYAMVAALRPPVPVAK